MADNSKMPHINHYSTAVYSYSTICGIKLQATVFNYKNYKLQSNFARVLELDIEGIAALQSVAELL